MVKVTKTAAIAALLNAKAHSDLAMLYNPDMECQLNVAQDGGEKIQGEYRGRTWKGWTDGLTTWKELRIPWNASSNPQFEDSTMSFDIGHAEAIGMTGWDWKNRLSRWVAYDFDAIAGHSTKHLRKLTDIQLKELRTALETIDWVTLRRSTSGSGLHLYVFVHPTPTETHTEHAALARAILGKLSALTGYDLETKVDVCGQNMWIWHRKMTVQNQGLTLLKSGGSLLDVPINWKDHIKVISGHRRRVVPRFTESDAPEAEQKFQDLANQYTKVPLDDQHKKFIEYLEERATGSYWNSDFHMLITHTYWLSRSHEELNLRGVFRTTSAGKEAPNDINCFLTPIRGGGWAVRRYSLGVEEDESWEQDGRGWTRCFFNTDPCFSAIARMHGGNEDPAGGFYFNEADMAADTLRLLGAKLEEINPALLTQKTKLKELKDGRVSMEIEGDEKGFLSGTMKGWLYKGKKWIKIFNVNTLKTSDVEGTVYDDLVRHVVSESGVDLGWALRGETGEWRNEPLRHIERALMTMGLKPNEIAMVIGNSVVKAWKIVNRPFQSEYPGDRLWNQQSAQLKHVPTQGDDLDFTHWSKILKHLGCGLDSALESNAWAISNGVTTGLEYLRLWIASLFKEPLEPLPYLFFYGPQNSGKSILHEAISLLLTHGYVRADVALQNQQGFNGELQTAVCCVIEEVDLRKDKNAANRIKDWVTAREISIHPKGKTPYMIKNTTHWMQFSNFATACPVLPGDTRITSIYVEGFEDPSEMIPKKQLLERLEREAPDFLADILRLEIPPSNDRLNVPVIRTAEKENLEQMNRTPVEEWLASVYHVDGEITLYADAYTDFLGKLDPSEAGNWTKQKFGKELPPQFPKGRSRRDSQTCIGNLSLSPPDPTAPKKKRLRASAPDSNKFIFLDGVD